MKKYLFLFSFLCMAIVLQAQSASALLNKAKREQDPVQRVRLLSQAIQKSPKFAAAWHHRADTYRGMGKTEKALADYSQALLLTPKDPFRYYARGLAYMDAKKYSLAQADFTKAISYKKDYPDFYLYRAKANMALDKYSAAVADYHTFLTRKKKTPEICLDLAQAYIQLYQYEEAEQEIQELQTINPADPQSYFLFGRILHNQGLLDEAVSQYSKALHRDGTFAPAYRYRASAFKDMAELEAAAQDYTQLLNLTPEPIFYNRRGLVYEEMNEWEKALQDYNKTIEISPKWSIAYNNRGYIYLKQGKYDQARQDFEKAVSLENSLPTPYVNLAGVFWLSKQDKKQVYRYLEMALKRGFKDFDSLYDENKKGWMFATINKTAEFRAVLYE